MKPQGPFSTVGALALAAGCLAATALAVGSGALGHGAGLGFLLGACALWFAGLDAWRQESAGGARLAWAVVIAAALGLRATAGLAPLELSDDVHRYVWEGDLVRQGQSPYAFAPNAPERAAQRGRLPEVFERMNHTDISAAYPMGMQLAAAAVLTGWDPAAEGAGDRAVVRMRWFFGLCDLLVLVPLGVLLRRRGRSPWRALVWAACPLVAVEFAGSGHFDSLGILCLVGALACLPEAGEGGEERSGGLRVPLGMLLFACAVWVKLLPVLLLPFVLRAGSARRRLGWFALGSAGLYAPLLVLEDGGLGLLRGLTAYGSRWEGGSLVFRGIVAAAQAAGMSSEASGILGRGVALATILLVAANLWHRGRGAQAACLPLLGTFAVFTPMLHPWYLAWLVPWIALGQGRALGWLVAAGPLLYVPLAGYAAGGPWDEPLWTWALAVLPFGALLLGERRPQGT